MNRLMIKSIDGKDEWLTPPELINALGPFDLDPCSPITRPWPTATNHYTIHDHGLISKWDGRVWCNPPYSDWESWARKCAEHKNAILLIFNRTEVNAFHTICFAKAHSIFFIKGRLSFYHVNGQKSKANAGGGNVLVSFDEFNTIKIQQSKIKGKLIILKW